jgi:uncharacterized protein
MPNKHGDFVWYELITSDADAAGEFYGAVVGWTSSHSHQPDMDYRFFSSGDGSKMADGVGGYMAITPDMGAGGARPGWIGYIGVDDVDASVAAITAAGGSVHMPAWDLPGVGRMAMVADPAGAPFYVMRGASDEPSHSFAATEPKLGHCAWNELASSDPASAKTFYGKLFGWVQDGEMDMGPMGKYEFWKVGDDRGHMIGAVWPKMPEMPVSAWAFYFRVADIDAAADTIRKHGGTLFAEPTEIPGGEFSLNAIDPQGAAFGLVGPRKGTA